MNQPSRIPTGTGVLETCLYVADLDAAARFYQDLFGFEALTRDDRLCALSVAGRDVLLLFLRGGTVAAVTLPSGGVIPPHDGQGETHFAFAIVADQLEPWIERLGQFRIPIESKLQWPRGGWSLYFRDPDQHLVELVTPGIWAIY